MQIFSCGRRYWLRSLRVQSGNTCYQRLLSPELGEYIYLYLNISFHLQNRAADMPYWILQAQPQNRKSKYKPGQVNTRHQHLDAPTLCSHHPKKRRYVGYSRKMYKEDIGSSGTVDKKTIYLLYSLCVVILGDVLIIDSFFSFFFCRKMFMVCSFTPSTTLTTRHSDWSMNSSMRDFYVTVLLASSSQRWYVISLRVISSTVTSRNILS